MARLLSRLRWTAAAAALVAALPAACALPFTPPSPPSPPSAVDVCLAFTHGGAFRRDSCLDAVCDDSLVGCPGGFLCVHFTMDWNANLLGTKIYYDENVWASMVFGYGRDDTGLLVPGYYSIQFQAAPTTLC